MNILDIKDPSFIKDLSDKELAILADDIRDFLVNSISKTGGHLSSNLGVVELTIALHYVFDSSKDKFIFDVGHQSYVHKVLTGRSQAFTTLRQFNGLSGFQSRNESIHDPWEAGHSSTSLSAGLGMAVARDLNHDDYHVIPIIGDGALTGGMAYEALNNIGGEQRNLTIIFNDNNMSISQNVGAVNSSLNKLRTSKPYNVLKEDMKTALSINKIGENILEGLTAVKNTIKKNVIDSSIFTELGIEYFGPIDGHDIPELIRVLELAKKHQGPVLVHVLTTKGKGVPFCEHDHDGRWHGVGKFDPKTGQVAVSTNNDILSWSEVISTTLVDLAKTNDDIIAITPAMMSGSKLENFSKHYPDRFFDVGIAEEHATTFAAGLAAAGKRPFLSIYSTFLQRAYDQVNHDVARMNLPVVIGVDRAGITGEDGATHQGVFDISLLTNIPNMIVAQPKDAYEAQHMLYTAFIQEQPFALRYPRGSIFFDPVEDYQELEIGTWTLEHHPETVDAILITYGPDVDKFKSKFISNNFNVMVVNARYIKPLDKHMLDQLADLDKPIITYENEVLSGGLSSHILQYYNDSKQQVSLYSYGIDDVFVPHGSISLLRQDLKLDINTICIEIKKIIEENR